MSITIRVGDPLSDEGYTDVSVAKFIEVGVDADFDAAVQEVERWIVAEGLDQGYVVETRRGRLHVGADLITAGFVELAGLVEPVFAGRRQGAPASWFRTRPPPTCRYGSVSLNPAKRAATCKPSWPMRSTAAAQTSNPKRSSETKIRSRRPSRRSGATSIASVSGRQGSACRRSTIVVVDVVAGGGEPPGRSAGTRWALPPLKKVCALLRVTAPAPDRAGLREGGGELLTLPTFLTYAAATYSASSAS